MSKTNNKIEHLWSVICKESVTDSDSNNITLTNVLEEVQVALPPGIKLSDELYAKEKAVPIGFELITMWKKLVEGRVEGEARVDVINPNGKETATASYALKIEPPLKRLRARIRYNGLKISVPGEYVFVVKAKLGDRYEEMGRAVLEVKLAAPQK